MCDTQDINWLVGFGLGLAMRNEQSSRGVRRSRFSDCDVADPDLEILAEGPPLPAWTVDRGGMGTGGQTK